MDKEKMVHWAENGYWHVIIFLLTAGNKQATSMKKSFKRDKGYLSADYNLHVKDNSRIADHCYNHMLSDNNRPQHQVQCQHKHDLTCPSCLAITKNMYTLRDTLNEVVFRVGVDKVGLKKYILYFFWKYINICIYIINKGLNFVGWSVSRNGASWKPNSWIQTTYRSQCACRRCS